MGLCRISNQGNLDPNFVANQPTRAIIVPPDGILKRLDFYFTGDHTTDMSAQEDGESNIFSSFRVTVPRKRLPNIVHDILPRDSKWLTAILEGSLSEHLNPTGTTLDHQGRFSIFYAPPRRLTPLYRDYGIDTRDLSGPIIIEALYNGVASIGASSTAITNETRISACVEERTSIAPSFVLAYQQNRLDHTSDARLGPETLGTANLERLAAIFLRQHDDSGTTTERVDGLITRFIARFQGTDIHDELFQALKQRTAQFFQFDRADYPDGIGIQLFAEDWNPAEMLPLKTGNDIKLIHDSVEALPDTVTNITPASGDAIYAITMGVQLTAAARGLAV